MKNLKQIANENITKKDIDNCVPNDYLIERVYMSMGLNLSHIWASRIVFGDDTCPKLISVLRAIQKRKKEIIENE